jgi:metal-responsive CopG/Arc/MetJ family transcriptional regulator
MTTKLNLSIEEELVEDIKKFAKKNKQSVSQIVSEQLKMVLAKPGKKKAPFSQRAAGIIKGNKFNDLGKLRDTYLKEKHGL